MNDLGLNVTTGDLDIQKLDLYVMQGADAVRQQLFIKLNLWREEWFLDIDFGTPYLQEILGKRITLGGAIAAIKNSILEVDDVNSITDFSYNFNRSTRKLVVDFEVDTLFGLIRTSNGT